MLINQFTTDRQTYETHYSPYGDISFYRIEKSVGKWDFEEIVSYNTDTIHTSKHAITVIRHIVNDIEQWVKQTKPHYFYFCATDRRKHDLYMRLCNRYEKRLDGYLKVIDGGKIHFYRES